MARKIGEKQPVALKIPITLLERIDAFSDERGFGTRTQAIFYLINYALDELTNNKNKSNDTIK